MSVAANDFEATWKADIEAKRQKTLKREASMLKLGAPVTFEIGTDVVVITRQPMEWGTTLSDGTHCDQKFKAKYKVEMNGVHRGWIISLSGFGSRWALHRVGSDFHYWDQGGGYNTTVAAFLDDGHADTRDRLARAVPGLVAAGRLGTETEQTEATRKQKIQRAIDKREIDAAHAQHLRDLRERNVARRATLQERIDTLNGILAKKVLTNYEAAAIADVIAELQERHDRIGPE